MKHCTPTLGNTLLNEIICLRQRVEECCASGASGYRTDFDTELDGGVYQYTLTQGTHGLSEINSIMILNEDGDVVSVSTQVQPSGNVYIESNLPLENFTIILI